MLPFAPSRFSNPAAQAGSEAAGQPEVTEVTTVADSDGSLHEKYFMLSDGVGSVGVRMNTGALREKFQVDFTGLTGADFATEGEGKYFFVPHMPTQDTVWFNTGTEVSPSGPSGDTIEVNFIPSSLAEDIVSAVLAALVGTGNWLDAGTSGAVLVVENVATGPQADVNEGNSGTTVSTLVNGRDAALGAVSGADRTVIANFSQNDYAAVIAAAIASAFAADSGLSAEVVDNVVVFTDLATGPRTDAVDGDTGFSILTLQQGA